MKVAEREYQGYVLSAIHHPPVWQVHITPLRSGLPQPHAALHHANDVELDRALDKAMRIVNELIDPTRYAQENCLKAALEVAVARFKRDDGYLFQQGHGIGVQERCLMFRIAHYLQLAVLGFDLPGIIVDCEYNLNLKDDFKRVWLPPKIEDIGDQSVEVRIAPDIIVHRRGTHGDNLLVVEIKRQATTADENFAIERDRDRLRVLTSPQGGFGYALGCLLIISRDCAPGSDESVTLEWVRSD